MIKVQDDMPVVKSKRNSQIKDHNPRKFFKNHEKVAGALLQSLEKTDADAFLEILNTYLYVNRTKIAKETKLSRTTVQNTLLGKGNPTIRTIAKIVHKAVSTQNAA